MNPRQQNRRKVWSQVSCGVGNALCEVWKQLSFSFGLIFLTKVSGLTSGQAGLVLALGQITALLATAMFGYLCDSVDVPCISRRFGRKKTWHLFTTTFVLLLIMMSFSGCFVCNESTPSWSEFIYFVIVFGGTDFFYGASEMSHLSIIPVMSKSVNDSVIINSIR